MAARAIVDWERNPWKVVFRGADYDRLMAHLFPGDHDEHGAILAAGLARSDRGTRLLVRHVFLAEDGVDFVPSKRAYRRLTPEFVNRHIRLCRDQGLAYLAVHNHGGRDAVGFSAPDMASHERGYPALLDIARGQPVGALVLNENAVAGDIWTPDDTRRPISETKIIRTTIERQYPAPIRKPGSVKAIDDRQARIYGADGQALFAKLKVGVIGAGGVGLPIVAHLARLGVGHLVVVDPDRVEISNLPRLPETTRLDAMAPLAGSSRPWIAALGRRLAKPKVDVAKRIARRARTDVHVDALARDVTDPVAAAKLTDCDYLFLAANTHQARAVFNALVHQYLIPGVQIGSLVEVDKQTGPVGHIFSVVRPVIPQSGCLQCNGLISPATLQEESLDPEQLHAQRYGVADDAPAPSVMTLNSLGVARATNEFMLAMTGLRRPAATDERYLRFETRSAKWTYEEPRRSPDCLDCGEADFSGRARGDSGRLPVRVSNA